MKKLTLFFISLALCFGMGTASAVPAPEFVNAGEVLQGEALDVAFPPTLDLSVYLSHAFILYVENDDEVELTYSGTASELQALAQGGSPASPLSAKAGLPYRVADYDSEFGGSWNPAVYLTGLGEVRVRARLAVSTNWDGQLIYSDEFYAVYTVTERPLPDAPAFLVGGKEVQGADIAVNQGTAVRFESGYEDRMDDYIVCYVVNGSDEDFADATPMSINMGNAAVKMYDPYIPQSTPVIYEAQTMKAATGLLLESNAIWWSDIVTVNFTIKGETPETVAMPVFNPAGGEVEKGTKVTISCETEGATIYYMIHHPSDEDAVAEEYTEPIVINENLTVKAWAFKDEVKSEEAEASYTVKQDPSANEDEELAGVTVYPNPGNGVFHITLPVAASIEVFMSNGMLYQHINANAGEATLNINRSGIYFLRITGQGRTAIKRVIVR